MPCVSFRSLLAQEFEQRQGRNRRYSLRAFARALRTDHATLSQILRRKRALTAAGVRRLAAGLGLDAEQTERFCVEIAMSRLMTQRTFKPDSRKIARRLGISVDEVNVVLQRLLRLRVLSMNSAKSWRMVNG
jgi:hypothetical protein